MSKLNIDQKTVKELFSAKKTKFLIPDYQRPYAWGEDECQTLWEDLFNFSFPENNCDNFDSESDEYFLGPIVTFKNDKGDMEIIDGQQRLTTLMLLLRAFYDKFKNMKDDKSEKTREQIEACIWKTDEFGYVNTEELKINYDCPFLNNEFELEEIAEAFKLSIEEKKEEEMRRGQSCVGPHRDDIVFYINGSEAVKFASQGQQRTIVLALKLSELDIITAKTGDEPVLLLDDVLAELDDIRQNFLLKSINENTQTIITSVDTILFEDEFLKDVKIYRIENGNIV